MLESAFGGFFDAMLYTMAVAKITRIKAQKNKKRVNIYLDGKFAFGLDADNFLKAGLKVGQKLTEKQVEDLIFKNEFQKLFDKTLRLISRRPRSEKEIYDYLKKNLLKRQTIVGLKRRISEDIIEKLKEMGVLGDEEFTRWWVEQRLTFRPRGKFGLTMELRQKGVDKEIIKKVVEEKVEELPLVQKMAQKKLKAYKNLPKEERYQKMSAFLARRGFSWETIKKVVDETLKR